MIAVFKTGGKQYSVQPGQILKVEKIEGKKGPSRAKRAKPRGQASGKSRGQSLYHATDHDHETNILGHLQFILFAVAHEVLALFLQYYYLYIQNF